MKPVKKNSGTIKKVASLKKAVKPEITTIIFDFGNVLVVDTEKAFEEMFDLPRLPEAHRFRYEMASHETERGEKPTKHLLQVMKEEFGLPMTLEQINTMMISSELIRPMWNLLQQLRKSYRIAILTNNQKSWPKDTAKKLKITFDGIKLFNSANIGSRKPEKEPFAYALKKLKVKPEHVLFIDDKKVNVETAADIGIKGIRFNGNMEELMQKLKKYGVEATMNGLDK
jgi:HAD superfamily hydrolase (TIGR01509 family)